MLHEAVREALEPAIAVGRAATHRGMVTRVEDDVLVTKAGNLVIGSGVPKSVSENEAICGTVPLRPFSTEKGGLVRWCVLGAGPGVQCPQAWS